MAGGIFAKELEGKLMKYMTKYDREVDTNLVEKTDDEVKTNSEVEVNITECTKLLGNQFVAPEYEDTTESSSSFGDSNIGAENVDSLRDSEATSAFHGDAESAIDFGGFVERFRMRKKKLTTHWRSFIQPLMWRCKWVELQIKKLEAQARKYDRELEAYNKQKKTLLDKSIMIDSVKSLPFSRKNAKSDVFKRMKRRKAEATVDVAAYMLQHNLFSYHENRKCLTKGASSNNVLKNPKGTHKTKIEDETLSNDELSFEPRDGDDSLENIFRKIDFLKSRVGKLKCKADKIKRGNAKRFSFTDSLILSPPHRENGMEETHISSQTTGVLAPQTAVTSSADFTITNGSIAQACLVAHTSVEDGVLIDNQRVNEEGNNFEKVRTNPTQMPLDLKDGPGQTAPYVVAEPDPFAEDQLPLKMRSIAKLTAPKSKRKRGRKRVASGRKSRRSTG